MKAFRTALYTTNINVRMITHSVITLGFIYKLEVSQLYGQSDHFIIFTP